MGKDRIDKRAYYENEWMRINNEYDLKITVGDCDKKTDPNGLDIYYIAKIKISNYEQ